MAEEIAAGRAVDQVQALHDKIEDAKASGKSGGGGGEERRPGGADSFVGIGPRRP